VYVDLKAGVHHLPLWLRFGSRRTGCRRHGLSSLTSKRSD